MLQIGRSGKDIVEQININIFVSTTMADAQTKLPPSKLGEYTVLRDIAEGTFGKVKSIYISLIDKMNT